MSIVFKAGGELRATIEPAKAEAAAAKSEVRPAQLLTREAAAPFVPDAVMPNDEATRNRHLDAIWARFRGPGDPVRRPTDEDHLAAMRNYHERSAPRADPTCGCGDGRRQAPGSADRPFVIPVRSTLDEYGEVATYKPVDCPSDPRDLAILRQQAEDACQSIERLPAPRDCEMKGFACFIKRVFRAKRGFGKTEWEIVDPSPIETSLVVRATCECYHPDGQRTGGAAYRTHQVYGEDNFIEPRRR